jgi:hypothetical protein
MVRFGALLSGASDWLGRWVVFALVPLVVSLVSVGNFARIANDTSDVRIGIDFPFQQVVATS